MHHATTHAQPTKTAENESMAASTVMGMIPRRRLAQVAFALLATALLLTVSLDVKAQEVVLSKSSVTVPEDGTRSESYGVSLTAASDTSLSVVITTGDGARLDRQMLVFTSDNWNREQYVKVTGIPDNVDNPNDQRVVTYTHEGGPNGSAPTITVYVTDDDTAGLTITPETRLTVYERGIPDYLR